MTTKTYFTPGPAQLYPTAQAHLQQALELQIPSISHRSRQFQAIYQQCFEALKALLHIPADFAVLFTGSATEIWERIILNCSERGSFHLVNGAFSEKFYEVAAQLKHNPIKQEAALGEGFDPAEVIEVLRLCDTAEIVGLTHNETSAGVSMPEAHLHQIAAACPEKLTFVDMVSSAPYPRLDYGLIDSAYFSVQKGFGLPAGLGVWIVGPRCLAKAQQIAQSGKPMGALTLMDLWKNFEKFQTPATPNVLAIYLLGKVAEDMLRQGIDHIRQDIEQKAKALYDYLGSSSIMQPFVRNEAVRSQTVVVADLDIAQSKIMERLQRKGFVVGTGYKEYKEKHLRIANFPATTWADIENLIKEFKKVE
ncbi:MAG TPA: phosphoserine aminotransferase [Microscillaceae bacterium]|nr:phosphoserine aminotransferase [Microscillaceae bacterium]